MDQPGKLSEQVPPPHVVEAMAEAHALRGSIVNTYAQVEFLLADLVSKCRRFDEYKDAIGRMPFPVDKRVRAVKGLCAMPGPLQPYASDLVPLADRLLELEEDRHFLTHGFCTMHWTPSGDLAFQFRRFDPTRKDEWFVKHRLLRPLDLRRMRDAGVVYAQTALMTFSGIYFALKLEQADIAT